jgi:methionyl-tRNA synthetase
MRPFLPHTADELSQLLHVAPLNWDAAGKATMLAEGHQLAEIDKLHESKVVTAATAPTVVPQKATITFEDFEKMDLRVGTIMNAEKVSGADKLLKLRVNTGIDTRTVVSGIAKFYAPEQIVGKQVCLLVNLAPRKLKGIESQGMILMAENAKGELVFVSPIIENTDNGSIVK